MNCPCNACRRADERREAIAWWAVVLATVLGVTILALVHS